MLPTPPAPFNRIAHSNVPGLLLVADVSEANCLTRGLNRRAVVDGRANI